MCLLLVLCVVVTACLESFVYPCSRVFCCWVCLFCFASVFVGMLYVRVCMRLCSWVCPMGMESRGGSRGWPTGVPQANGTSTGHCVCVYVQRVRVRAHACTCVYMGVRFSLPLSPPYAFSKTESATIDSTASLPPPSSLSPLAAAALALSDTTADTTATAADTAAAAAAASTFPAHRKPTSRG